MSMVVTARCHGRAEEVSVAREAFQDSRFWPLYMFNMDRALLDRRDAENNIQRQLDSRPSRVPQQEPEPTAPEPPREGRPGIGGPRKINIRKG